MASKMKIELPFDNAKFKEQPVENLDASIEIKQFEEAHILFYSDIIEAFIPNNLFEPAPREQLLCKARIVNNNLQLASKSIVQYNSTLQHEFETLLPNKVSNLSTQIQPNSTQPEPFYAHTDYTDAKGIIADSKEFPISNSSYCNFASERLYFLDTIENLQQYYIIFDIILVPTWKQPIQKVIAYSVMRLDNLLMFSNYQCDIQLYKYVSDELIIAQMHEMEKLQEVEYQSDNEFKELFAIKKQVNSSGELRISVGYKSPEEVLSQRKARLDNELALLPLEEQRIECEYNEDVSTEEEYKNDFENVEFDPEAKVLLDQLHKSSIDLLTYNKQFLLPSSQKPIVTDMESSGPFMSESISAVAVENIGNVALGACAVVAESSVYNILLFNIKTGSIIAVLGSHFGYVYELAFSPCGNYLASCSADGNINIFNVSYFTYYGFNFWHNFEINQISKNKLELQASLNAKNESAPIYQEYLEYERECDQIREYKEGSMQNDIEALKIITNEISACGADLNEAMNELEQVKVYELTKSIYVTTITVGLCVYDILFVEIQDLGAVKVISPELVLDEGMYMQDSDQPSPATQKPNFRLLFAGYNCELNLITIINGQEKEETLSEFESYINTIAAESVRIRSNNEEKRIFYIFSCDILGNARIIKLDYELNGQIKTQAFECPDGVKSALFMEDCKKILLLLENGKVVIIENNVQNQGQVYKEFALEVQEESLPGGCKICKIGGNAYIGQYGGKITVISAQLQIYKHYQVFNEEISGLVPSCIAGSKYGILVVGFNVLQSVFAEQFVCRGAEHYISAPFVVIGCRTRYNFEKGRIIEQEETQEEELIKNSLIEESHQQEMIEDYLEFIRNATKNLK